MLQIPVERESTRKDFCLVKLGLFGTPKRLDSFSTAMVAKLRWQLVTSHTLWTKVATSKYIAPLNLMDWTRQP